MAGDQREPVSSVKSGPQERSISDGMQRPGMAPKPEAELTHDVLAFFGLFSDKQLAASLPRL